MLLSHLRDALAHLHQKSRLQDHPLTALLVTEVPAASRGAALKRMLLDSMQQLRPDRADAYHSPAWRQYRTLFQHYVEGQRFEEIAEEQGISSRQARRDHLQAIDALVDVLWAKLNDTRELPTPRSPSPRSLSEPITSANDDASSIEGELHLVETSTPEEPTRIEEVLQGVLEVVDRLAEGLGTRIELALPETLPPVEANQTALRQALVGLVSYAVESSPAGRITLLAAPEARGASLRIVARGWAGPSPTTYEESARLAVIRRLLEIQGGGLEVQADEPGGVSFALSLPRRESLSVLVVDDNPDVLRLFQRYLGSASYHLVQATTAQAALKLARENPPWAITLDLMMPAHDGWELLQTLRREPGTRDIPVIVCSVLQERTLALTLGASFFLPKPVTRAALVAVLDQCRVAPRGGDRDPSAGSARTRGQTGRPAG